LAYFFHSINYVLNLTKNGLGYTLGDFFTNWSGHPVPKNELQVTLPYTNLCRRRKQ
jgi:hypothetical protein